MAVLKRTFGRKVEFDKRSFNFPITELLKQKKFRSYTWTCPQVLDQKTTPACVGFSFIHELLAKPAMVKNLDGDHAKKVYRLAQTLDQWPGENYAGTSVIAGVKAIQQLYPEAISEYRWGFGLRDLIITLGYYGPAVLGVNWYEGMYAIDSKGYINATGHNLGGHAILARGVNVKEKFILLHNSWGPQWGVNGTCKVSFETMEKLLHERGEVCVPVKRKKVIV